MKKIIIYTALIFLMNMQNIYAEEETLILFDSSVSMGESFKNGQPKYKVAADATKRFIDTFDTSSLLGLRIIGIILDSNITKYLKNPGELCKATNILVPIKRNSGEDIKMSLDTIFPLGMTPLEYSLDLAINYDFSQSTELRHIILVTDGIEGCNGDPCGFIKKLMQYRNDIKIDIIALGVEAEELWQLKCISDSTKGKTINVNTAEEIKSAYSDLFASQTKINEFIEKNNQIKYGNYLFEIRE